MHHLLKRLNHLSPPCNQDSHHPVLNIVYRSKVKCTLKDNNSPKLDSNGTKLIQSIVGSVFHYRIMINSAVLVVCNEIGSQ